MKAVFFDLDGTLFDTRGDLAGTVNRTRADLGLPPLTVEDVLVHVGLGAGHLLQKTLVEQGADDVPPERLRQLFRSHYDEEATRTVRPYPGVLETLETLRRRGWRLGVNTAKPRSAVLLILAKFGLTELFGAGVVAGGDCAEMKPSALPLLTCAARLGHVPDAADWMVGDNWTDIECAARAGVRSAFCTFGFGRLGSAEPTVRLASFSELADYLP